MRTGLSLRQPSLGTFPWFALLMTMNPSSVSDLVQSLGYETTTFASAEEYLRSDHVENSSCVITDVRMPGMSGVDLQARLRASGHKTPIIFITSFPSEDIRTQALKAGAFGFFRKPFDDDKLAECLKSALAWPLR